MDKKLPNTNSVVRVGGGRGFVIVYRAKVPPMKHIPGLRAARFVERRLIVTAAHCLALSIPCHSAAYSKDRMCPRLGTLDGKKKKIWGECLFVDPIADIAVLGEPDGQELPEQAEAYDDLTGNACAIPIGAAAKGGRGWILSLAGRWVRTTVDIFSGSYGGCLSVVRTEPGMSGSPILNDGGQAVGIIAVGTMVNSKIDKIEKVGPQPILARDLPCWLVDSFLGILKWRTRQ